MRMAIPQMRYGDMGYRICGIADGRHLTDNNSVGNHMPACARGNTFDRRFAKILRLGKTRTNVGVDPYNVFNSNTATTCEAIYDPANRRLVPADGGRAATVRALQRQFDFDRVTRRLRSGRRYRRRGCMREGGGTGE
jgi:hypothetical protein